MRAARAAVQFPIAHLIRETLKLELTKNPKREKNLTLPNGNRSPARQEQQDRESEGEMCRREKTSSSGNPYGGAPSALPISSSSAPGGRGSSGERARGDPGRENKEKIEGITTAHRFMETGLGFPMVMETARARVRYATVRAQSMTSSWAGPAAQFFIFFSQWRI